MGNCVVLCRHNKVSCFADVETCKNRNIVQLLKSDGEIVEFSTPVLVEDVLKKFSGCNIALAEKTPLNLPPNFWLKLGNVYHLIPSAERLEAAEESRKVKNEENGGVKRIKVVITRQQLQALLSKEVLAVDILSALRSKTCDDDDEEEDSTTVWKPKLETIPEEH